MTIEDVELDLLERRRHLVLDHLDASPVTDHVLLFLDRADPADIEAHRRIELERVTTCGGLTRAEDYTNLHSDLVDEDDHGPGLRDRRGQLAKRLAHQPRLKPDVRIAHLTLEL